MAYTLKLNDGTVISDLTVNGNNLVSPVEVAESLFIDNLETVTVSDGETETEYHDLELIAIQNQPDGWYIALRQISEQEKKMIEINDVINAMLGIENEVQHE